jgi:hypothetical protein
MKRSNTILKMKNSERVNYMKSNSKPCKCCGIERKYYSFWKDDNWIPVCKTCHNKNVKVEEKKMVLEVLSKMFNVDAKKVYEHKKPKSQKRIDEEKMVLEVLCGMVSKSK